MPPLSNLAGQWPAMRFGQAEQTPSQRILRVLQVTQANWKVPAAKPKHRDTRRAFNGHSMLMHAS